MVALIESLVTLRGRARVVPSAQQCAQTATRGLTFASSGAPSSSSVALLHW
ncbi:MAG: hypothetical protein M3Y87_12630 [Myxococcota bacterium]|nr:hypothetical protein [Myxococcota bacterium]